MDSEFWTLAIPLVAQGAVALAVIATCAYKLGWQRGQAALEQPETFDPED
jgi:hypothetical protein